MPSPAEVAAVRENMVRESAMLHRDGRAMYESARHAHAARTWEQSAMAAEAGGRSHDAAESRFWQGVALHGAGRLHQALAALAAVATSADARAIHERTRHMALSRAVLVAVDLPAPLASIERAIADVERVENHTGKARTARILLVRARLAQNRGQATLALEFAREGLVRARIEDAGFAHGTYLKEALRACIRLGYLDEADELLRTLDRVSDAYTTTRNITSAAFRSMIARARGDVAMAVELGRAADERARPCDDVDERLLATEALVRALLCTREPQQARAPLASLLRLRNSQFGSLRYHSRLLLGDYHVAMARHYAGMPAGDAETGRTLDDTATPVQSVRHARAHQRYAHRAWRAALRVGRSIDDRLQCQVRETQLAERQRQLDPGDSAAPYLPYITA